MFRVALYRVLLKIEFHPVQKIKSHQIKGAFFSSSPESIFITNSNIYSHNIIENGYYPFSGDFVTFDDALPNWHKNYFNNSESKSKNLDWWKISDFDSNLGDIKTVWELSRFDWAVQLAITASSGDKHAIYLLNSRLNDWIKENPYYKGVNWKCGQEASIRVLHLILAALILDQSKNSSKALISLIEAHVKRIAPTISYAIAQNNNHGTSEAAALFVGGYFLVSNGLKKYENYELLGRNWLEDRAKILFSSDGCFSQYSVNYHRLALDTYTFCETYRKFNNLQPFSGILTNKIKKAIHWLEILTDPNTGDVPNLGANDGAQLFKMFINDYRDFRQSVQWANLVFNDRLIYPITENHVKLFKHLKINVESAQNDFPILDALILGNEDGFFIYRKKDLLLVFRRPIFKFRPSQSDILHIDLWVDGVNVLRDGGSYSYNKSNEKSSYYNGISSHNSIQFDKRDQMPVLGRFLFGSWLKEVEFEFENLGEGFSISSAYHDHFKAFHKRELVINKNSIIVKDWYSGVNKTAQLRWRFIPKKFDFMNSNNITNEIFIDLKKGVISGDYNLNNEYESRYYYTESILPVITKDLKKSGIVLTNINW